MIVTRIALKNWKNFRDVEAELGKRVFLLGPNAAGKSNFLDALRFLRDVAEGGLARAVAERGGISRLRCLAARQNPDVTIMVQLDETWSYSLTFGGRKGESPVVKEEKVLESLGEGKWKKTLIRPNAEDKDDPLRLTQTALEQVIANKDFREIPNFFRTIKYRHILPQAVRTPKDFTSGSVSDDPYGRDFVLQMWNTPEKTRTSRLRRINDALKIAVPQLEKLDVVMDKTTGLPHLEVNYDHWRLHGARQDEYSLSDGTLRLLALLWSLFDERGPLLLEEPELSLHDEVVRQLPAMFVRMERSRAKAPRQYILSTHSAAMLSDRGIGPGEILRLQPGANGTEIFPPDDLDIELLHSGLSVADVVLPRTRPERADQLSLFAK